MNKYGLAFHHLGLAVANPHKAKGLLKGLGYSIGEEVEDDLQQVKLIMCQSNHMPDVEIIFSGEIPGPIDNIIQTSGEGIYHMCYTTKNLSETLTQLKRDGNRLICVSPSKPAILFGGKQVSFYMVTGFGLIEILEG